MTEQAPTDPPQVVSTQSAKSVACGWCGTVVPGGVPGDWSFEAGEAGRAGKWLCPACTREHVRAIEGKLSADWW